MLVSLSFKYSALIEDPTFTADFKTERHVKEALPADFPPQHFSPNFLLILVPFEVLEEILLRRQSADMKY